MKYIHAKQKINKNAFTYELALNQIDDYVFVFDRNGEIAAQNTPLHSPPLFKRQLASINEMIQLLKNDRIAGILIKPLTFEMAFDIRRFYISSSIISDKTGNHIGAVMIIHDITNEQDLIHELQLKNEQIRLTNTQLMQEININEELLIQKERETMSLEIQSEIGIKMEMVIKHIEDSIRVEDKAIKLLNLKNLANSLRDILADIRRVVYKPKR